MDDPSSELLLSSEWQYLAEGLAPVTGAFFFGGIKYGRVGENVEMHDAGRDGTI
jgi:hypothetical protein